MSRMLQTLRQMDTPAPAEARGDRQVSGQSNPALGDWHVPSAVVKGKLTTTARTPTFSPQEQVEPATPTPTQSESQFQLQLRHNLDDSRLNRQYQQLTDKIVSQLPADVPLSFMFVAAEPGQHAADALAHVAALLSRRNVGKVLLVDGNLAEKSLTAAFDRRSADGLAEILNRRRSAREFLVPTALERLNLLPAGREGVTNFKTTDDALAVLLRDVKHHYRFVLVDAGCYAEPLAASLARICDATYFVVQLGQTDSESAATAVAQLQAEGARMRGAVVNSVVR
jgi:Mrp family chromosome partitioning ATPase